MSASKRMSRKRWISLSSVWSRLKGRSMKLGQVLVCVVSGNRSMSFLSLGDGVFKSSPAAA